MSSAAEQQSEELEVLRSIFDGDTSFSITDDRAVHYRFGDDGADRSFLLEFRWPPTYPDECGPEFRLKNLFYNKHLNEETRTRILECLETESTQLIGSPMTYSLIEVIKDRFDQLMEKQIKTTTIESGDDDEDSDENGESTKKNEKSKKEILTKAQKRKQWDRGGGQEGERARGWNWVDLVKHLSQTGGGQQ